MSREQCFTCWRMPTFTVDGATSRRKSCHFHLHRAVTTLLAKDSAVTVGPS